MSQGKLVQAFARNLARIRKGKNLRKSELARRAGVTRQIVDKWERGQGNPALSSIGALCEGLNVPLSELLGEAWSHKPRPGPEELIAEKVADRVGIILGKHPELQYPETWISEFLGTLRYDEVAKILTSAPPASTRGPRRERMQKAISKLDPATIEAIVRHAARQILERFVAYVRSKRSSR